MNWKVFTLDDEKTKLLGQEISNELGRKVIELLKYPKSPNDLAKELNQPLTTVIFHIEKLVNAGVAKPIGRMAGRRGRKTLYTLVSPAFLILPVRKDERESLMRNIMERVAPPREIIARSLIIGLLVAIFIVGMPWYLLGYNAPQSFRAEVAATTTKAKPMPLTETVPTATASTGEKGETKRVVFTATSSKINRDLMIMLIFGVAASLLAALITAFWILHQEGRLYSEHSP